MKTTSALISSLVGLVLVTGTMPLRAQPADPRPRTANREEIRRLLRDLPPEERRALIKELRDQKAAEPNKPRLDAPKPPANREEISRQLQDLPPEERRARVRELRGLPPEPVAAPRPEARRPGERDFQRGERPPFGGPQTVQPGRFAPMFERVLTEDQRASFREAMESQRGELRELEEKLRAARREALQTSIAREFNEDVVREKAMATASLEAEMAVVRARTLSRVKPSLTPGQLEKLQNLMPPEGGAPRPEFRRDEPPRGDRPVRGPRDENDLPPRPRPEQ
jgi:Spy/CpxP family protein refolding chaperone